MTTLTPESVLFLLADVEAEDPIDFAELPFEETDLRKLACLNVVEFLKSEPYAGMNATDKERVVAATLAKLVLENMVMHARLLASGHGG